MPSWIKSFLKLSLLVVLWVGSLYWTASEFYMRGAYYGYHIAAQECNLYALQKLFNGDP